MVTNHFHGYQVQVLRGRWLGWTTGGREADVSMVVHHLLVYGFLTGFEF